MKHLVSYTTLAALTVGATMAVGTAVAGSGAVPDDRVAIDSRLQVPERQIESRDLVLPERTRQVREALNERLQDGVVDARTLRGVARSDMALELDMSRTGEPTQGGAVTVLAANGDIRAVANAFGLTSLYEDSSTGLVIFDASGHDDVIALVQELRSSDLVRAARPARTNLGYELDVMQR